MIQRSTRKSALGLVAAVAFGAGGLVAASPAAAQLPNTPAVAAAAGQTGGEVGIQSWVVDQTWPYSSASERTSALAKCKSAASKALASGKYTNVRCEDVPKKAVVLHGYRSKAN